MSISSRDLGVFLGFLYIREKDFLVIKGNSKFDFLFWDIVVYYGVLGCTVS